MTQTQNTTATPVCVTPSWVRPVDGATCAEFARMVGALNPNMTVVEFCDYVTSATLAFQTEYALAEWGETYEWMDETEAFLFRYMLLHPVPRSGQPASPVYATNLDDDAAISDAEALDAAHDAAGADLCRSLDAAGIRCRHYGDGIIEVEWNCPDMDLRVVVSSDGLDCPLVVDVVSIQYHADGTHDEMETFAVGIPWLDLTSICYAVNRARESAYT